MPSTGIKVIEATRKPKKKKKNLRKFSRKMILIYCM